MLRSFERVWRGTSGRSPMRGVGGRDFATRGLHFWCGEAVGEARVRLRSRRTALRACSEGMAAAPLPPGLRPHAHTKFPLPPGGG